MSSIPSDVCRLIEEHIDSVAQLEALVLMKNSNRSDWTAATLAKRLYIAEDEATRVLSHLSAAKLIRVEANGGYGFAPESEVLAGTASLLVEYHATHLIPLTRLIHEKPHRIQQFANAFRFRKE